MPIQVDSALGEAVVWLWPTVQAPVTELICDPYSDSVSAYPAQLGPSRCVWKLPLGLTLVVDVRQKAAAVDLLPSSLMLATLRA